MYRLIKTVNKFNGNLCFVGGTDLGDVIFEVNYETRNLAYKLSTHPKPITDICLDTVTLSSSLYFVCFGDNMLGIYAPYPYPGTLTIGAAPISCVSSIIRSSDNYLYFLDKDNNKLYKYDNTVAVQQWVFDLPAYSKKDEGRIIFRESDKSIIYNNDTNIYVIRDNIASAALIDSIGISGAGEIKLGISGEFNPSYFYMRKSVVETGTYSSSSSSSYIENWSSSSLQYSSSSSSLQYSSSSNSSSSLQYSSSSSSSLQYSSSSSSESSSLQYSSSSESSSLQYSSSSSSESSSLQYSSSSESSSSESSGYLADSYCLSGCTVPSHDPTLNGAYARNGQYYNENPVFQNGIWFLWLVNTYARYWIITKTVGTIASPMNSPISSSYTPEGNYLLIINQYGWFTGGTISSCP